MNERAIETFRRLRAAGHPFNIVAKLVFCEEVLNGSSSEQAHRDIMQILQEDFFFPKDRAVALFESEI